MFNKNKCQWIVVVLFSVLISACATSQLDLSLDFYTGLDNSIKPREGVLGVDEFIDLRPQASTSDTKKWLGFIPGVFWLTFVSEMPDTYTGFSDYKSVPFKISLAQAIYKNIEQNRIFERTVFLPRDKYASIDYRFEGILNRTVLKETGYYYGSGVYAWITRIIGLPYVSYEVSIDITLILRRITANGNNPLESPLTPLWKGGAEGDFKGGKGGFSGEIIWTYELKGTRRDKYYNIYQLAHGKEGKHILSYNISKILEEQMPVVLQSMRRALEHL
ncbi:MAG: hypothetical protein FJ241_10570 [Nitrospira sp.]|nr:hypothetical protein [Nitrospira sp.]